MNILLINHYAGSPKLGMEYRPYYLSKIWVSLGHNVTILVADNAHVRNIQPTFTDDFHEEIIDGVRYVWVKTPKYIGNGIKRIFNMFTFVLKLEKKSKQLAKKYSPDIVIASSTYPWDNYAANKIAKKSNAKHFYEVHDLWPLSPIELGGLSKYHPFIMLMQRAENFAYKKADMVISMLPKTKEHMQNHGLDLKKWHYIPNGISLDEWQKGEAIPFSHTTILQHIRNEEKLIIAYAGSHGVANALDNFIEAAKILKKENITFVLVGNGPEKENLKQRANFLENVYFLDSIPKESIPTFLSKVDILYIGLQKQPLFRFGISPNKLMDYMMAEKPIIQAIEAGNDPVSESGCGISVEAENPDELAKAILKIESLSEEERASLGKKGKEFAIKNHDYDFLAKKFLTLMQQSSKFTD